MRKVLIISINALPLDVISSYRAKAYCDHLLKHDIHPTLLTTRWEKGHGKEYIYHNPNCSLKEETFQTHKVIRLPNVKPQKSKSSIHTFFNLVKGNIDVELIPAYKLYRKFLLDHVKNNKYDLIIGIFSPHFHLKLTAEIGMKFNIPYVLDFRDLWGSNRAAKLNYMPTIKEKAQDILIKYWWRKWLNKSLFYSITSQEWLNILNDVAREKKGCVIKNGIENFYYSEKKETKNIFKIIFFGALYPEQNIQIFFDGFSKFVNNAGEKNIVIEFIGLKEKLRPGIKNEIIKSLPKTNVRFLPTMSKKRLVIYCQQADLFWYPSFVTIKGWFSAKIYDYLALGKKIIVCPGDGGEVDEIVKNTNAGVVLNTSGEVVNFLEKKANETNNTNEIPFSSQINLLKDYTREAQVEKMAVAIKTEIEQID